MAALFLAVLAALGFGGLYLLARRRAAPPILVAEPDRIALSWTKASVVLAGVPDPYNPQLARLEREANARKVDPGVAQFQTAVKTVVFAVPVVGQVAAVVDKLLDTFVGPLIRDMTHGGFDDLTPLARQRAILYGLLPDQHAQDATKWKSRKVPRPYPLQQVVSAGGAPVGVTLSTGTLPTSEAQAEAFAYDACRWLGFRAELYRVSRAADEPMLPVLVINLLHDAGEWPPPVRPVPLLLADFQARFQRPHPLRDWNYGELAEVNRLFPEAARRGAERAEADYQADATAFHDRIAGVAFPDELRRLALEAGCIPELGDTANPDRRPRGGVL